MSERREGSEESDGSLDPTGHARLVTDLSRGTSDDTTRPRRKAATTRPRLVLDEDASSLSLARRTPASRGTTDRVDTSSTRRTRLGTSEGAQSVRELDGVTVLLGAMVAFPIVSVPVLGAFTDGSLVDRCLVGGALAAISLASAAMFVRARRAETLQRDAISATHALVIACSIPFLILGLGMCTAATGLVAVGILLLSANVSFGMGAIAYTVVTTGHALIVGLALAGVVSTIGLGDVVVTPKNDLVLSGLFVIGEYTAAFALGSMVRRRWSSLIDELRDAVRIASEREVLLREVRDELQRAANRLGPGRFTGQDLGSFRLGDVIGRGGMGEVYAATRIDDGVDAAVKVLQRGMLADRELVDRFAREARAVSSFVTPHVTAVYEVGDGDSPVPFIAMERLRGQDLATILRSRGSIPVDEVARLVREVAAGLAAAHAVGIVHRDLKPSNVFHATDGSTTRWKILDFGIAKQTQRAEPTLTRDQIIGTPQYMAPEQASGMGTIDHRADVHALAAIAYRAITGRTPWHHPNVAALLVAVARELPVDPSAFAQIEPDVALVLRIGLAKSPDERPQSAADFASAFEMAASGRLDSRWRVEARAMLEREPWGSRGAVTEVAAVDE